MRKSDGNMASKQYGVILADPPWSYDVSHRRGAASSHYSCMAYDDLIALPIQDLSADNCVLLMWATFPKLFEAAQPLISAWGFDYVTGFPWIKVNDIKRGLFDNRIHINPQWGTGYWIRGASELVLIAKRGKPRMPKQPPIGLLVERGIHSKKPDSLHEYAEMLDGPYLELFARRPRPGWDVWGNEVDSTIDFDSAGDEGIL